MTEQESKQESETISTGSRLAEFVADPAVADAINRLKTSYFTEFMGIKPEDLNALSFVKAKVTVLEDFLLQLQGKIDAGKFATVVRDRREKNDQTRGKRK